MEHGRTGRLIRRLAVLASGSALALAAVGTASAHPLVGDDWDDNVTRSDYLAGLICSYDDCDDLDELSARIAVLIAGWPEDGPDEDAAEEADDQDDADDQDEASHDAPPKVAEPRSGSDDQDEAEDDDEAEDHDEDDDHDEADDDADDHESDHDSEDSDDESDHDGGDSHDGDDD